MTRCAIMQPTYLPWSGYFNLIESVDRFVFLDCVQLERQSWQTRNRILLNGNENLLSVPVKRTSLSTEIKDAVLSSNVDWKQQHLVALEYAYQKAPFGNELLSLLMSAYLEQDDTLLAPMTMRVIRDIAAYLRFDKTEFIVASDLGCSGNRSDLLSNICNEVACDTYLSPVGSAEYLMKDQFVEKSGIALEFQAFEPASYKQFRSTQFISHLSVVDVIANLGPIQASKYCAGRYEA